MKESIRCCISCILPCGALDVIRIVHASGRVEEITHSVFARDIMQSYPKHVLRKPLSVHDLTDDNHHQGGPRNVVLPPNAELQRGKIYFLMPLLNSTSNDDNNNTVSSSISNPNSTTTKSPARRRRKKRAEDSSNSVSGNTARELSLLRNGEEDRTRLLLSDQYLSEILSEKVSSSHRERRRGRVRVWQPHLESICENITNDL